MALKHLKEFDDLSSWTLDTFDLNTKFVFYIRARGSRSFIPNSKFEEAKSTIKNHLKSEGIGFKEIVPDLSKNNDIGSPAAALILLIEGKWSKEELSNKFPDYDQESEIYMGISLHPWDYNGERGINADQYMTYSPKEFIYITTDGKIWGDI